jgi:2-polyprenyl-6-methoxyphenol hydroxylase-like FAD-dependent oxidoreductase
VKLFVDPAAIEKFWLPRAQLVELLLDRAKQDPNIEVLFNASCSGITLGQKQGQGDDGLLKVTE